MKINKTYQFSDEDIKMLKIPLPYDPCEYCGNSMMYCCGCQKQTEYVREIAKYKTLGIYDIACNIREVRHIQASIRDYQNKIINLQAELDDIKSCIPQEVLKFLKL